MNILVTGASGYIGRLLIPRLAGLGHHVICMARSPQRLFPPVQENVELRRGDCLDPDSLVSAMKDVDVAYYLVHSMADGVRGYVQRDHMAAENFAHAARQAGVKRIIYLGGLGECDKSISPHLEARQQVGLLLRQSGVPVTEFRAAIIIGSGSMSFEMIRYLTERLPVLFTPPWINTLCQPIAIENVLEYLLKSLSEPRSIGATYEIGGPDVLTYEDIMRGYATVRKLKRRLVNLPFLTIRMLAVGADIVTPLPAPYLHILIEGLRSEVVVRDPTADEIFQLALIPYARALEQALDYSQAGEVEAYFNGGQVGLKPGLTRRIIEGTYIEQRRLETAAPPGEVYATFSGIGGKRGWYVANGLWKLRGWLDKLIGGVGNSRPRRSEDELVAGDVVGGYTVEAVKPGQLLRLRNDLKAPGPAWMQFEAQPGNNGKTLYIQTAFFAPHGLAGLAYWYALYPFHQLVFDRLARAIVRRAEAACPGEMPLLASD